MKRYFAFSVLFILSALQSFAQVETHYYQKGDTSCFVRDYLRLDRVDRL